MYAVEMHSFPGIQWEFINLMPARFATEAEAELYAEVVRMGYAGNPLVVVVVVEESELTDHA